MQCAVLIVTTTSEKKKTLIKNGYILNVNADEY